MNLGVTTIFYLVIGVAVAIAYDLAAAQRAAGWRAVQAAKALAFDPGSPFAPRKDVLWRMLQAAMALVFWPLYLPLLLSRPTVESGEPPVSAPQKGDEMAIAIAQVEAELDAAFSSLDGWAEGVLAREAERIRELRTVWTNQAERVREMDRLLAQTETEADQPAIPADVAPNIRAAPTDSRRRLSEQARLDNLRRLRRVREQAFETLMGTLAWVRELVSMIHLSKFTGAPATRAEELVAQIAAAVEGVSAVTWQDEFTQGRAG